MEDYYDFQQKIFNNFEQKIKGTIRKNFLIFSISKIARYVPGLSLSIHFLILLYLLILNEFKKTIHQPLFLFNKNDVIKIINEKNFFRPPP